jgi:O-antigen ligase
MPTGFMSHINLSAFLLCGMFLLSFVYRDTAPGRQRHYVLAAMCLFFFCLIISPARIGHLSFLILSPWMLYNLLGKKRLVWVLACMVLAAALMAASPTVRDRTSRAVSEARAFTQGEKVSSIGMRLYMWDGALRILGAHPLAGVGTGGYMKAMRPMRGDPSIPDVRHPHNSYLHYAASHGVPGLAAFGWLLFLLLRKGWRHRGTLAGQAVLAYTVVFMLGSIADSLVLTFSTTNMLALTTGLDVKPSEADNPESQ